MCCDNNAPFNWYIRLPFHDPLAPSSYKLNGPEKPTCIGSTQICAIYANEDGTRIGQPIITGCLKREMVTALSTGKNQTCVLLRPTA